MVGGAMVAVCLAGAAVILHRVDAAKPQDWQKDQMTYLPSGKYLKPMVLGFDEAAASLLWVKGVVYFGEAYLTHGDDRWMGHILDIVTTLNPRFKEAYQFAASLLTKDSTEIPNTLQLIHRGLAEFPDQWQWRVSAALARLKLDSNYLAAAEDLKPVAADTSVPKYIKGLLARFLEKGGGDKVAIGFLTGQYLRTENAMQKEIFSERLAKIGLPNDKSALGSDSIAYRLKLAHRTRQVRAILRQAEANPQLEPVTTGILHEVLLGNPAPGLKTLLQQIGAE